MRTKAEGVWGKVGQVSMRTKADKEVVGWGVRKHVLIVDIFYGQSLLVIYFTYQLNYTNCNYRHYIIIICTSLIVILYRTRELSILTLSVASMNFHENRILMQVAVNMVPSIKIGIVHNTINY